MGYVQYRSIGPFRAGRVVAVAGDVKNANVFYFGAVAGGIWKTDDGGTYWECVSDHFLNTSSIGALAVSESDPNVIYAGTGETTIRIDVSHGDGVYKSTDLLVRHGSIWGYRIRGILAKSVSIPTNPDIVYVAALGHAFGKNEERGVFRSMDGGNDMGKEILYVSDKAGAVDLTLDPNNPRILYAAIWGGVIATSGILRVAVLIVDFIARWMAAIHGRISAKMKECLKHRLAR